MLLAVGQIRPYALTLEPGAMRVCNAQRSAGRVQRIRQLYHQLQLHQQRQLKSCTSAMAFVIPMSARTTLTLSCALIGNGELKFQSFALLCVQSAKVVGLVLPLHQPRPSPLHRPRWPPRATGLKIPNNAHLITKLCASSWRRALLLHQSCLRLAQFFAERAQM